MTNRNVRYLIQRTFQVQERTVVDDDMYYTVELVDIYMYSLYCIIEADQKNSIKLHVG